MQKVYLIFDEAGQVRSVCGSLIKAKETKRHLELLYSEEEFFELFISVFEVF